MPNVSFDPNKELRKPKAKLIMINIPVTDAKKGRKFYKKILGTSLPKSLYDGNSYHAPVSSGVQLELAPPHIDGQPTIATFAVKSLKEVKGILKDFNCQIYMQETDLKLDTQYKEVIADDWENIYGKPIGKSMGKSIVAMDPFGNVISFVEMEDWAEISFSRGNLDLAYEGKVHHTAMQKAKQAFPDDDDDDDDD